MIQVKALRRVFIHKVSGAEVRLPYPQPKWSVEAVRNYYSGQYSELTTASVAQPTITEEAVEYRFNSVLGTKG